MALLSLVLRQVAARLADKDLAGAGDFLLQIDNHLLPLCQSTHRAGDREHDWEHCNRQAHRLIDNAGIEIDVWIEFA